MKGYKKRRGAKFLSIAYLYNQALALPLPKDKQTKVLPTPSDIINPQRPYMPKHIYTKIHSTYGELHLIYIYKEEGRGRIRNSPTRTLRCITAVGRFKFARFDYTDR